LIGLPRISVLDKAIGAGHNRQQGGKKYGSTINEGLGVSKIRT
jgi:hypothetical protein